MSYLIKKERSVLHFTEKKIHSKNEKINKGTLTAFYILSRVSCPPPLQITIEKSLPICIGTVNKIIKYLMQMQGNRLWCSPPTAKHVYQGNTMCMCRLLYESYFAGEKCNYVHGQIVAWKLLGWWKMQICKINVRKDVLIR